MAGMCAAYNAGRVADYPAPRPRKVLPQRSVQMLLVVHPKGWVLMEKRPPIGIWGGLWSFPELTPEDDIGEWSQQNLTCRPSEIRGLPARKHSFSHFHLHIHPRVILLEKPGLQVLDGDSRVWYNLSRIQKRGLAAPVQQLLQELKEELK